MKRQHDPLLLYPPKYLGKKPDILGLKNKNGRMKIRAANYDDKLS